MSASGKGGGRQCSKWVFHSILWKGPWSLLKLPALVLKAPTQICRGKASNPGSLCVWGGGGNIQNSEDWDRLDVIVSFICCSVELCGPWRSDFESHFVPC